MKKNLYRTAAVVTGLSVAERALGFLYRIVLSRLIGAEGVGKQGDLVIWDAPDLDYICYRVGSNLADTVIKRGVIV